MNGFYFLRKMGLGHTVVGLSDFFYFSKYFTGHTGKIIKILKANLNRVNAKPFHVLRFTVSKPRKVSTKKKCMRKNRDFRFTAPYVIEAHFSLKLY